MFPIGSGWNLSDWFVGSDDSLVGALLRLICLAISVFVAFFLVSVTIAAFGVHVLRILTVLVGIVLLFGVIVGTAGWEVHRRRSRKKLEHAVEDWNANLYGTPGPASKYRGRMKEGLIRWEESGGLFHRRSKKLERTIEAWNDDLYGSSSSWSETT